MDALGRSFIKHGNNLDIMGEIPDETFQMIYMDPPFNTGRTQKRERITAKRDDKEGNRYGFGGKKYITNTIASAAYEDHFDDYLAFLEPRLLEAYRLLTPTGTLYFHIDPREVHYVKIMLDGIFGRKCFLNELIWAYDYGGKSKSRWPQKHDNILVYVKDPKHYYFNSTEVDREPYMAPGLVTPEKVAKGKLPTSVWWHTIVPTAGKEKTGYPTQKPEGIIRRMVTASSQPGDMVFDPFAGSGTLGAVAQKLNRTFYLIDESEEAIKVMEDRLGHKADL